MSVMIEQPTEETTEAADRQPWRVKDAGSANWLLGKLAAIRAERALVKQQAAAILRDLDAQEESLNRHLPSLEEYAREELAKRRDGRKSLPLLYGTLAFRTVAETLRVADTAAAFNAALETGHLRLDADGYRREALQRLQENGELLPGMEKVAAHEKFGVQFGKAGAETVEA